MRLRLKLDGKCAADKELIYLPIRQSLFRDTTLENVSEQKKKKDATKSHKFLWLLEWTWVICSVSWSRRGCVEGYDHGLPGPSGRWNLYIACERASPLLQPSHNCAYGFKFRTSKNCMTPKSLQQSQALDFPRSRWYGGIIHLKLRRTVTNTPIHGWLAVFVGFFKIASIQTSHIIDTGKRIVATVKEVIGL